MKIRCNIVTGAIKDLAKQIGRSDSYTCNLVSVWQTQNGSLNYPTAAQLNDLLKSNNQQAWDIYLAVPNYEVVEYNPKEVPIRHELGQIYLMRLPKENPMGYFYNMYRHLPELKELAVTPEEAYRFILWREMAFMQYDLSKKTENRPIAEGEAIKKAREWRKKHPIKVAETPQPTQQSPLSSETKINIYAGTNENADLSNFATRPFHIDNSDTALVSESGIDFISVEQAFQYHKLLSVYDELEAAKFDELSKELKNSRTGADARAIGRKIPMSAAAINKWDSQSSYVMKELLKASFEQNPQALQRLLATGNAILTHTQDKGKWGTEFPKLLMEVRDELRASQPQVEAEKSVTKPTSTQKTTSQPQVVTKKDTENVHKVPEIGVEAINVNPDNPVAKATRDFTAIERRDRVAMLARTFSQIVDRGVQEKIQEVTDAINEELSKENPDRAELNRLYEKARLFNDSVEGRRAVMEDITVQGIFQQMRDDIESYTQMTAEELDKDYGKGKGQYIKDAYQKVLDNWYELLKEACIAIENREFVRVIIDTHSYDDGTSTREVVGGSITESTQQEDKDEEAFNDDEDGNRVDGNGGWSFKVRFVDPRATLSKGVKQVLGNIKREGINGEIETDDLGNVRYIDPELAHSALINDLSGMIDADDFSVKDEDGTYKFPALDKIAVKYPWVNQIITALQTDPTLISSFYADFRKDFIPYWMQYYDEKDGKWKTKALNQAVALDSTMTTIIRNYEQGTILDTDSIYESGRKLNTQKAQLGSSLSNEILTLLREFDDEDYDEITEKTAKCLRMVGLNTDSHVIKNLISSENGLISLERVVNALRNIFDGAGSVSEGSHLIDEFSDDYSTIAQEVGLVSELDNIQSFRLGDKTYYSYSAPNYLDTMFKTFKSDARRNEYLQRQFGKYEWFKNQRNGQWMSGWLELIENDEDVRYQMALKELNTIKHPSHRTQRDSQYTNWSPLLIKNAFIREYFSVGHNAGSKKQFAWYNMPIFSDSPVTKFIKFLRYTTDNEGTFKEKLLPLFNKVVKQELGRIKLVQDRRAAGVSPIANFDKNGNKFHFFPELNSYERGNFLARCTELTKAGDLDGLDKYINDALTYVLNENFTSFLDTNFNEESYNELRESLIADGTITSEAQFEEALEEYFWNQAYATSQIIELTTTDLAYYKDGTDFQKRYKEVYAAGTKLNTNSRYGRKIERTMYLADQIITSSSYRNIKTSLDRAVQLGHIKSFDRNNILSKFKDINVADAQAYRSLDSMRAILDMMGAWTPEMQQAMDRFDNGEWDMADFNLVWQTIKPFVFTQIEKPDGLGGSIKVPHQNKNSEFLLLSMYHMVANSMGKSPKLKALNRFMKDKEIDVIQFESAVKAGKQGTININYSEPKLQAWKTNHAKEWEEIKKATKISDSDYSIFKAGNDYLLDHDMISQEEYNDRFETIEPTEQEVYDLLESMSMESGEFNPEVVHEIPYSDYVVQQPTPEHLFDHTAVFGSQFRNLIVSDMPDDPSFRVRVNGKDLTKQEVLRLYQSNIVENLLEDWRKVKGKFANIEALQKAMLDAVKGNPKYGRDMLDALQIVEVPDPNDSSKRIKVFNIPLDNPSTTAKIQELVTSMFKNAITKQSIKGASCILVSDFGLTKELSILHGEDGSIQGIECYLPAYSKQFYEPFMVTKKDAKGNEYQELDINKMPMELRRIIGYRIPTEDKYSMAPLIIKGFLPQQNGSCIMLPADITQIAGSDFDVDKMFLMIPEFSVQRYDMRKAREDFAQMNAIFKEVLSSYTNSQLIDDLLADDTDDFKTWFNENKEKYEYETPKVRKVKYDMGKLPQEQTGSPALQRKKRNNMLIDIAWGILTNPDTAEKIHNPGSFDKAKIAARIASIISDPVLLSNFVDDKGERNPEKVAQLLLKMSREGELEELDSFIKKYKVERSQLTVDTFIYNHRQNMTGAALIGMYANNTSMQAKYQSTGLSIKDDYIFFINKELRGGKPIQSLHDIMSPLGERISKNCANFSAASVDNVKDPVLADLMQNTHTANITGFMLRAGMSIEEIGLLFSQPIVRRCISDTGSLESLGDYIRGLKTTLKDNGGGVDTAIQLHDFTSEELMMNVLNEHRDLTGEEYNDHLAHQIQAGLLMEHIAKIAKDLSDLTKISRADSPNGAISTSIAGAKNQSQAVNLYMRRAKSKKFTLTGVDESIINDYISLDMDTATMREKLLRSKMPLLQAFYSLGIELGPKLMGEDSYFIHTLPYVDSLVEQLYDNSPHGIVEDTVLNKFYSELVEFGLSKTKLLGDDGDSTFDEKRDYYLYDFPKVYMTTLANNPDIAKLGVFKKLEVKDGSIIMKKSGRLTPMMRDSLMRDFDILINDIDNPTAQKLAIDLFMYSYYKDGFKFGPNSFGTLFSSNFITSFPEFIEALRELRYNIQAGTYFKEFLPQFYANHWRENLVPVVSFDPTGNRVIKSGDNLYVSSKLVINRNLFEKFGVIKSYPLIAYEEESNQGGEIITTTSLYTIVLDGSGRVTYEPAIEFTNSQKGKRGVKYNANMTTAEMANVTTSSERIEANSKVNQSTSRDVEMTGIDSTLPATDFDMNFEGFESKIGLFDDALNAMEQGDYSEEAGNAELNEPMCK